MDPMQLAQAALAALAPVLAQGGEAFAKKAGEAAFAQARSLWALLRGRAAASDPARAAALEPLDSLGAHGQPGPEPTSAQHGAAAEAIGALLAGDAALRDEVERALHALRAAQAAGSVQVSGGQVGQIVQVGHVAGNLTIGGKPD